MSPPYGVCMSCMDAWSACAPLTSHYSTTSDPGNLGIRKACDAKKPVDVNAALAGNATIGPATFIANATIGASCGRSVRLLGCDAMR